MALFKLCRGAETNLPITKTNGYAYFCTDTQNFYIDWMDSSSNLIRSKLAVEYADKLRYTADGTTIEIDPTNILTKNNTTEYTPVDDYNPATKKYVDDSIPDVVTTSKSGLMTMADKSKLDGIEEGAQANNVWYGMSGTAATTQEKVVNTVNGDFQLQDGSVIFIRFSLGNSNSYIKLNVDNTGAKRVSFDNNINKTSAIIQANCMYGFVYDADSQYFYVIGGSAASEETYGLTRLSTSVSSTSQIFAATSSAVKQTYDLASAAVPKSGGTMTGDLILNADPTENLGAATKQYVDDNTTSVRIVRW